MQSNQSVTATAQLTWEYTVPESGCLLVSADGSGPLWSAAETPDAGSQN